MGRQIGLFSIIQEYSKWLTLNSKPNAVIGLVRGAARALRREGRVPAVIYGDKKDPISISLPYQGNGHSDQKGRFSLSHPHR